MNWLAIGKDQRRHSAGFGREPLAEMQKVIEAENSDLFDALAYVLA